MTSIVKSAYRALLPAYARERIAYAREWARLIVNYLLVRSKILGPYGVRPHALYIEGTNICNARCVFCAYPQMERPKVTMPMELFRKAVDEYLALGLSEVDLTPIVGDPFVDKHLFDRLDYLASRPEVARFHFYTNAILVKPEWAQRLMGYGDRFWIFCSFGGFDRETYRKVMGVDKFAEAVAAIRHLIETKVRTKSSIRVTVNLRIPRGSERGEFWEYLQERAKEGAIRLDGVTDYDNWGGKITGEALAGAQLVAKPPPVHRGPCRRLLTGPVVLADGRVNACCCRDVEATLIIGDLNSRSLADVLAGPELKDLLARHEKGDFPEICKTCTKYQSVWSGVRDD
ncbi:MAG: radical SAM protein [Elusimicrobia bacterium]|nr:radical SAM protein [Elusimicrobiota bacterium]